MNNMGNTMNNRYDPQMQQQQQQQYYNNNNNSNNNYEGHPDGGYMQQQQQQRYPQNRYEMTLNRLRDLAVVKGLAKRVENTLVVLNWRMIRSWI